MPEIVPWLKKKADKYVSHDIQNEYLQIMALRIIREVSSNIRNAGCYTIMADECTDISNKEQFAICITKSSPYDGLHPAQSKTARLN